MKVLTLWQPWATLVVMGAKMVETRSFNTKFSGEVLIHSSSKPADPEILKQPFFSDILAGKPLPLGMIIGKVTLDGTFKTDDSNFYFYESDRYFGNFRTQKAAEKAWGRNVKREMAFGDYSPGRYGWELFEPVEFTNHTPFKGGVGFTKEFRDKICLVCGCTENNCSGCIEKIGVPCHWLNKNLCSACKN